MRALLTMRMIVNIEAVRAAFTPSTNKSAQVLPVSKLLISNRLNLTRSANSMRCGILHAAVVNLVPVCLPIICCFVSIRRSDR